MKPKVLITWKIPGGPIRELGRYAEVYLNEGDRPLTVQEIMDRLPGKMGLLSMAIDSITEDVLQAGCDLKIVANYAVGFNNIDLSAATRRKIAVTNTPDVLTDTTADLTFALILGVARRVAEGDRWVRAGKWIGWKPDFMLGTDVHGKTLGVIGLGRIGLAVAKRAVAFNMKILYFDPRPMDSATLDALGAQFRPLPNLLRESDFVTLHVPLTAQTRHLIGPKELQEMKRSAFLINASRGPVVDEKALVEALRKGEIAGAGLDVFEEEPKVSPELMEMENVLLLPHIGSATVETREKMAQVAVNNIIAVIRGEIPPSIVNPEIYTADSSDQRTD